MNKLYVRCTSVMHIPYIATLMCHRYYTSTYVIEELGCSSRNESPSTSDPIVYRPLFHSILKSVCTHERNVYRQVQLY